ncbi:MAG: tryptophan synthase subunit beta [Sulfuricurvum sp. GWF2_44_89]|uniref:Tryptophan synthase beta chain n=1 Tax=Sulfuricurvum kujiense TaxID=148813 RepID=A0A2D3WB10_9BACT|nr:MULTISPECIES: tryptophan synthase subunit beta [Sulfuricurvum]OHD79548.1 MAG: tryptophan synthase subunit beta [Sulfuricurvum sp. GWF2_44_89]OHD94566.1 MAG: tryptophan synthase subunit beta [Sulfuricurvum sp. RIFOXYD12_FULL_44_77]OHD99050.1 MAG: tryptophan synthase subunit beta [Sulfuricurvum sp. RIFOXYD2_FULL_44_160]DAB37608.1 MAG TPA: tryptophan synthase subunit beta [Sulfuricurvum kujiense]
MYIPSPSKFDPVEGHFGIFGGRYVPETLMPALLELEEAYKEIRFDKAFWSEVDGYLTDYVGRPSPLYYAANLSKELGAKIYLKREDLNHTGAHKVNNVIAQGLMAKRLGKKKVIAETGAGQHGVATATIAALLGLECEIFMGAKDVARQELNVFRMKLLGAKVHAVESGSKTLKDAMNDAIRHWVTHARDTFYIIGTVAGPHPYPMMVRDFQAIIGCEARAQILEKENRLPDYVIACIGGGSNAIGTFQHFLEDKEVRCIGIEAGGLGVETDKHGCSLLKGRPGVLHGQMSYLLQDDDGQILEAHSISAGLDYPGIGPEHAFHKDNDNVTYDNITDQEALDAFVWLSRAEGIIPAFETAHAVAYLKKMTDIKEKLIIVNLSGRGDKDMMQAKQILNFDN